MSLMEQQAPAPQVEEEDEAPNVSEEEQASYDKVVTAAQSLIYDEKNTEGVQQMLANSQDPGEALGSAAAHIVTMLDEQSGGKIPEEVIIPAATEIMDMLVEFGEATGALPPLDEAAQTRAMNQMIGALAEEYEVDAAGVEEVMRGMGQDELQQMGQQAGAAYQGMEQPQEEQQPMPPQGGMPQ